MLTKLAPIYLCLLIASTQSAFAKDQLLPGYYINKNGDSVLCKIEYSDWVKNPRTIVVEENNIRKTLGPGDIRAFGVTGYADYRSATVSYHLGAIKGDLPEEFSVKTDTNDCFLLVLVNGPYSLYTLTLEKRYYFFISEQGGPIKELVYRVRQSEMLVSEDEQYKGLLTDYMIEEHLSKSQSYSVKSLTYSKDGLIALVNRLNEAHSGIKTAPSAKSKSGEQVIQLDIFAGAVVNTFPSEFSTHNAQAKFPATCSAAGGLGLHIVFPGHFNAFSIGISVGYSSFRSSTSISGSGKTGVLSDSWYDSVKYKENLSVANSLLTTNFYFMYLLPGSGKFRYYGKLAASMATLLKSGGKINDNWSGAYTAYHSTTPPYPDGTQSGTYESITFRNLAVSPEIAIGAQTGRHRAELAYCSPMDFGATNQPTFNLGRFGLYYFYTILK